MITDQRELTRIHLNSEWLGGDYVAETWRVQSKLTDYTHRQLVTQVMESWPELFYERAYNSDGTSSFTTGREDRHGRRVLDRRAKRYVRSLPAYVLAVILTQI